MSKSYLITIEVTVHDPKALRRAAKARAKAEGLSAKEWADTRTNAGDDLVMLLEPGSMDDAGCTVMASEAERGWS